MKWIYKWHVALHSSGCFNAVIYQIGPKCNLRICNCQENCQQRLLGPSTYLFLDQITDLRTLSTHKLPDLRTKHVFFVWRFAYSWEQQSKVAESFAFLVHSFDKVLYKSQFCAKRRQIKLCAKKIKLSTASWKTALVSFSGPNNRSSKRHPCQRISSIRRSFAYLYSLATFLYSFHWLLSIIESIL